MTTRITKGLKFTIASFALAALMLTMALISVPGYTKAADTQNQPTKRTLNTSGQGTVKASPDIAYITLGVTTEHKVAKTAQQENAKAMDKVVASIKAANVDAKDIKTTNYTIYPKTDYNSKTGVSSIIGYTVTNSVQVTVRDITKTGNIIDLAATNGANLSSQIAFGLSDYDKYYNEALKVAIESAKKHAQTMADSFKIKLDVPVSINESGYSPVYNYPSSYAAKAEMDGASTPIASGELEVRASVSLVYEY